MTEGAPEHGSQAQGRGQGRAADLERRLASLRLRTPPVAFLASASGALLATAVSWSVFGPNQLADVVMIYLLGIVLVSLRFGYAPSLLAAVLSVFCFDFFFVPPLFTFAVRDFRHVVTFGIMFMVAWVISGLTQRVRAQAEAAELREQHTASLYALSRDLAAADQVEAIERILAQHVSEALAMDSLLLMPEPGRTGVEPRAGSETSALTHVERSVADWVWEHERAAGWGTDVMPDARASYLPLLASRGKVGVLCVCPRDRTRAGSADTRQHLAAFANQMASALERTELARIAQWAQLQMETEQMRSSLLSSVSHDLRTPLAVMTGAASTLLEDAIDAPTRRELTESILQEAQRLNRLVRNLLDMTRLEAGAVRVKKEWQPLEEVIGSALTRLEDALAGRQVLTELAAELPLVPLDAVLIEQVLVNLLENALKYTPADSPLEIRAAPCSGGVEIELSDRGPGIPPGEEQRIFTKFYRVNGAKGGGVGLGLAICRGIVAAHGGVLEVTNRPSGGARFRFQLPIEGAPPLIETAELAEES